MFRFTRRAAMGAVACSLFTAAADPVEADAVGDLAAIERRSGGRLGVFALDTERGRTLAFRADKRFPTQSTFKGPLAAAVLFRVDNGDDRLDAVVRFGPADLVVASPVTAANVSKGAMTVAALLQAVLERSDNTGANLLLRRIGGPPALDRFLRRIGDDTTSIGGYEPLDGAQANTDSTTSRAMATTMRNLLLGNVLSAASRGIMIDAMARNVPGRTRLRASFPRSWRAADRSGTGDGICNDVAIAWPPGRAPILAAVYGVAPGATLDAGEATVRAVGRTIVAWSA